MNKAEEIDGEKISSSILTDYFYEDDYYVRVSPSKISFFKAIPIGDYIISLEIKLENLEDDGTDTQGGKSGDGIMVSEIKIVLYESIVEEDRSTNSREITMYEIHSSVYSGMLMIIPIHGEPITVKTGGIIVEEQLNSLPPTTCSRYNFEFIDDGENSNSVIPT